LSFADFLEHLPREVSQLVANLLLALLLGLLCELLLGKREAERGPHGGLLLILAKDFVKGSHIIVHW